MAYDCRFQATLKDHIPIEYLRYISKEGKTQVKLPDVKQMFVKKCMVPALYRTIPPSPTSLLAERVKRNGLKHSIFNSDRDVYVGEWKNDKKEGYGSFKTHSGKVLYEGEWVNGKAEGYGVLCHQGDHKRYNICYEGFWKNGKPESKGYNHYKDGSFYKGGWANGVRNGFGQMWYADGTYYEGDFHKDKQHGRGLFVYVDGNRYVGEWFSNYKHGFGAYYYMNSGQIQMGHWIKDSCVNSWMIDMKYRQSALSPTEFSIPEKSQLVKQFKRDVVEETTQKPTRNRKSYDKLYLTGRLRSSTDDEYRKNLTRHRSSIGVRQNSLETEKITKDRKPPKKVERETPKWKSPPHPETIDFWKALTTASST